MSQPSTPTLMIFQRIGSYSTVLLAVVLLFFSVISCKDFQDCRSPCKAVVTVTFKPIDEKVKEKIQIDYIVDASTNKELSDFKTGHTEYNFPLNPQGDSSVFIIHHSSGAIATITVNYKRRVSLISPQCGAQQEYILKEVEPSFAKKPKIINYRLSSLNTSNIDVEIYF